MLSQENTHTKCNVETQIIFFLFLVISLSKYWNAQNSTYKLHVHVLPIVPIPILPKKALVFLPTNLSNISIKGILWNCRWSTPSIRICSQFLLRECISNHETKQASKFQSDPSPNRRLKYKLLISTVYFFIFLIVFLYRILRHFTRVL